MATQQNLESFSAENLFNVKGLVALVTGGGTGIGLMFVKALAQNGASKVYIAGRRLEVLQATAASIGPNVIPIKCDVTSKADLQEAVAFIEKDAGYLNLLVCNSGIVGPSPVKVLPETTLEEFADATFATDPAKYLQTFEVNVVAVWYTSMAFLKLLNEGNKKGNVEQSSQVVVVSSIASFNKKAPAGWAYGQSKAAATHAMRHLSSLLPQWNIRANAIAPGLFPSEMAPDDILRLMVYDEAGNFRNDAVPARRLGTEQDMAATMLTLASKSGGYYNGAVMLIDGGRLGTFPSAY